MLTGIRGIALREAALNAVASAVYGLLFWALWQHSIDQWYLPAGLRFAALLVTPSRRWLGLYVGEFAALFFLRLYMAPFFGMPWLLVGSAALFPVTASVVWLVKSYGEPTKAPAWHEGARFIAGAVGAAVGSKLAVQGCLLWLAIPFVQAHIPHDVPQVLAQYSRFPAFVLGDLLGILLLAPPALLWAQRNALGDWPPLTWHNAWTAPAFALLFISAATLGQEWKQAACYLLFVPAASLTITMGWRGAVIGTVAANFGVALGMHGHNANGASAPDMLGVQTVLAVFSISLLGVGTALSHHLAIAKHHRASAERANEEAQRTLELARISLKHADQDMHDRAKRVAAGHSSWLHLSRTMIDRMRKVDPNAAMELTYTAALESRAFQGQILEAMYPLKLDTESLYSVLRNSALIAALEETGIEIRWRLLGNASLLSADLKRLLYKSVIEVAGTLAKDEPAAISIYIRCGAIRSRQGGAIVLQAEEPREEHQEEPLALAALQHRIQIYGGSMRQRRDKVTVLLTERSYIRSARAA